MTIWISRMVAGVLVALVFAETFLTGWLLRESRHVRRQYDELRDWVAAIADELAVNDG